MDRSQVPSQTISNIWISSLHKLSPSLEWVQRCLQSIQNHNIVTYRDPQDRLYRTSQSGTVCWPGRQEWTAARRNRPCWRLCRFNFLVRLSSLPMIFRSVWWKSIKWHLKLRCFWHYFSFLERSFNLIGPFVQSRSLKLSMKHIQTTYFSSNLSHWSLQGEGCKGWLILIVPCSWFSSYRTSTEPLTSAWRHWRPRRRCPAASSPPPRLWIGIGYGEITVTTTPLPYPKILKIPLNTSHKLQYLPRKLDYSHFQLL